jgi:hypothetical protein
MSVAAAIDHPWTFRGEYHEKQSLGGPAKAALRRRLAIKMMPVALMTFAIAQWVSSVLGAARLETMVITFAWSIATGHQFIASRSGDQLQRFRWSAQAIFSALCGQILWVALPCVRLAYPTAWFSATLTIPPMIVVATGVIAVYWPLHPLVMGLLGRQASQRHSELEAPVLYCSFFLLSGNLVFAASAYSSVVAFLATRVNWRSVTHSIRVGQPILVCPIESLIDLDVPF